MTKCVAGGGIDCDCEGVDDAAGHRIGGGYGLHGGRDAVLRGRDQRGTECSDAAGQGGGGRQRHAHVGVRRRESDGAGIDRRWVAELVDGIDREVERHAGSGGSGRTDHKAGGWADKANVDLAGLVSEHRRQIERVVDDVDRGELAFQAIEKDDARGSAHTGGAGQAGQIEGQSWKFRPGGKMPRVDPGFTVSLS